MGLSVRLICILALVITIAGCAHHTEIPFDRTAQSGVKRIGVIEPAFPAAPTVVLAGSIGRGFGLVGALVDAGMQSSRDSDMIKLLARQQFRASDEFKSALAAALSARGYEPTAVPTTRPEGGFLKKLPKRPAVPV